MLNKINNNKNYLYLLVASLFSVVLLFATMFGDDLYLMHINGSRLIDYWSQAYSMYYTWSSRVIINFFVYFFTNHSLIYWIIFMGISMFALLYAFDYLFSNNKKYSSLLIVFVLMLFPFKELSTAGWISTTVTYFSPIAFGFLSLIPIKKTLGNKKISIIELIIYALSLIFACSNEQVMALMLACYGVAFVYFLATKRINYNIIVQLVIALVSALIIIKCPGNYLRKADEIANWFPTYNSISSIAKVNICFSTTMKWLLLETSFFPLFSLILSYLVFMKKKDTLNRIISLVPTTILILCNYFKNITSSLLPYLASLNKEIPYYGLVNAGNIDNFETFIIYITWALIMVIVLYEIIILSDSLATLLASYTLIGAGFISRMAMSLSPTIYASGFRTAAVFVFCLMAVLVLLTNKSKTNLYKFRFVLIVSTILLFINYLFVVANTIA